MTTHDSGGQYAIRAVDRAIDVLMAFDQDESPLSLAAVASRAQLSKPTAFRVLSSLRRRGFVSQAPNGDYELGFEIVRLAAVRKRQTRLWDAAMPCMRRVRDAVDETVLLTIRVDDHRYVLDQVESTRDIRRVAKIGERVPLYVGASGRVLLAALSDQEVEAYLERTSLEKLGPRTITDPEQLRHELASVRELGYAFGTNERRVGGCAVAVGVRDYTGKIVAALQITAPRERWTDAVGHRCLQVLAAESVALSARLGDRGPHPAAHLVDGDAAETSTPRQTAGNDARTTQG
jgi:IclR family transcriptional regulator, KDG regulon repressor